MAISLEKFIRYNANSKNKNVGDCVKRSISLAFNRDYNDISRELNKIKRDIGADRFNEIRVIKKFLIAHGASDFITVDTNDQITEEEFAQNNKGTYLCLTGSSKGDRVSHLVCIHNGNIYDSWDSSSYYVKRYSEVEEAGSIEDGATDDYNEFTTEDIKEFRDYIEKCVDESYKKYSKYYQDKGWDFENCSLVLNEARRLRNNAMESVEVAYRGPLKGLTDQYWNNAYRFKIEIPYVFNIRFTKEQIFDQIRKLTDNYIERKLIWWIIDAQKEATKYKDSYEKHGIQRTHMSFWDGRDKKVFQALPLWVRNLSVDFDVDNGRLWGEKPTYTLQMRPLASDTTHEDSVNFYGQNSKEIMSYINDYLKDPNSYDDSYDNYY